MKKNFNTRNEKHRKFVAEGVLMIRCLRTGGQYKASLDTNRCLCCKEFLKWKLLKGGVNYGI
jgi:hypothetical protein